MILNCIEKLGLDSKVYSVDLSYTYHFNQEKECGFQIKDAKKYLKSCENHTLFLGKTIADVVETIGKDIDMLILDTSHYLPGELLDFIVCLPHLSKDAVVIVDDLIFSHMGENTSAIATPMLFNTVTADKIFFENGEEANMAAFQLNDDSRKYVSDYFMALMIPWSYSLEKKMLEVYRECICSNYKENEQKLFEMAIKMNESTLIKKSNVPNEIAKILMQFKKDKPVLVYGAGARGSALKEFVADRRYSMAGFVLSDDVDISLFSNMHENIYHIGDIKERLEAYTLLVAVGDWSVRERLDKENISYIDIPNYVFPFIKEYVRNLR